MKKLSIYIIEKLHINKNTGFLFNKDKFSKFIKQKFNLSIDTEFYKYFIKWAKDNNVLDLDGYGWPGINDIFKSDNFIEDKDILKKYTDILLKADNIAGSSDYINFLYTDELFGSINQRDTNYSIIFKKKDI